ncbi:uncharacterized protein LOC109852007 isoform X1 [Pseudomyrmex gracilis]|uniref:uncharacterized protein LOC109852007 isoform X1 n=1 Tax=Pseudomyrmex gracilis TaxID=219809 RepID=UPI000995BC3E|nr:uncharacterized protein LOC109852007 isoform X1 [Pseudomyrmex gracilis]
MAFSGSSIAIVFIAAYAAAGPVQLHDGSNTLQRDEYGPLVNFGARYWNDRGTNQGVKQNLDKIGDEHFVRDTGVQFEKDRFAQHIDFDNNENAINAHGQTETIRNRPYSYDLTTNKLLAFYLSDRDSLKNARESDGRVARNLDQIGGGNLVRRNLDPIGGGNLLKRNLDQIGGGNLLKRNLDQIGGGNLLRRNLDQIGGGNLLRRNLDQIGGGNLVRSIDYTNAENRHADRQSDGDTFENLLFARNLDQIGGGNLVRNLDSIGGGNLVRSMN